MTQKISEVGRTGTAPQQSSISEQEYYKAFLEDFVNDLITTLYSGIRGGTIDLKKSHTYNYADQPKVATSKDFELPTPKAVAGDFDSSQHRGVYPKAPLGVYTKDQMENKKFSKLNSLFEAIIAEQDNEGTLENAIEEFFEVYVKSFGADYSKYKPQINTLANQIANGMKKDMSGFVGQFKSGNHVSKATQRLMFQLGNIAYSVFRLRPQKKISGTTGSQAGSLTPTTPGSTPPSGGSSPTGGGGGGNIPKNVATDIQGILRGLKELRTTDYNNYLAYMQDIVNDKDIVELTKDMPVREKQKLITALTKSMSDLGQESPKATWNQVDYAKTPKGWIAQNSRGAIKKGEIADQTTANIRDQAVAQSQEPEQDDGKVVQLRPGSK